jgi:hypothetical protein
VRYPPRPLAALAALAAIGLSACGSTLQDQPIPHNLLEEVLSSRFTVYWLGPSFRHLELMEAVKDPSGAITFHYGDCVQGGGSTCVAPVEVITSPDNSFVPEGTAPVRTVSLRGVAATLARDGATIEIPTGAVVVDVTAESAALADAAAARLAPINEIGAPGEPLPARLPNTGFGDEPLPTQKPAQLRPVS